MQTPPKPIVVLGCRVIDGAPLGGALGRRVGTAARLFNSQTAGESARAAWVFVSGGKEWAGVTEARAMSNELIRRGLPSAGIVEESRSRSTRENAANTAALLAERDLHAISLVTCDFHMSRASKLFRSYGLCVEEVPAISPDRGPLPRALTSLAQRASERLKGWLDGLQRASVAARGASSNSTRQQ